MTFFLSSCSTKYKGLHKDFKKFNRDVEFCLKKSCKSQTHSFLFKFSIVSIALAYGGGGGGGGGGIGDSMQKENKISFKTFNLCMNEKGYIKDENGIFDMPPLTCN